MEKTTAGGTMTTTDHENRLKRSTLLVAVIANFLSPYLGSAVNVALPAIQRDLSATAVHLSWTAAAFVLVNAMVALPLGKAADIWGRKRFLAGGIALLTISSAACCLVRNPNMLIALRALQGVAGGAISVNGVAIVTSVFPPEERGGAFGFVIAAVYTGLSAGPFVGGILTGYFGWQSIFISASLLGAVAFFWIVIGLKGEWADAAGQQLDFKGCVLYMCGLFGITYGASNLPGTQGIVLLTLGFSVLALFGKQQYKAASPLLDMRLFAANRVFAFSNLAALIHYSSVFAVTMLMSLYLQFVKGLQPQTAGLVLLVQPVIQAAFSPIAGRLSDVRDAGRVASAGMAVTAIGVTMLLFTGRGTPTGYIISAFFVLGLGYALFSSPNTNAIMNSVSKRHYGVASSVTTTMRAVGMSMSMAVATVAISYFVGKAAIDQNSIPSLLQAMKVCFATSIALCCAGIIASLARGSTRSNQQNLKAS
ncbi:MAG: MFS transporter [Desulfatiglandaceae bacterium]